LKARNGNGEIQVSVASHVGIDFVHELAGIESRLCLGYAVGVVCPRTILGPCLDACLFIIGLDQCGGDEKGICFCCKRVAEGVRAISEERGNGNLVDALLQAGHAITECTVTLIYFAWVSIVGIVTRIGFCPSVCRGGNGIGHGGGES